MIPTKTNPSLAPHVGTHPPNFGYAAGVSATALTGCGNPESTGGQPPSAAFFMSVFTRAHRNPWRAGRGSLRADRLPVGRVSTPAVWPAALIPNASGEPPIQREATMPNGCTKPDAITWRIRPHAMRRCAVSRFHGQCVAALLAEIGFSSCRGR